MLGLLPLRLGQHFLLIGKPLLFYLEAGTWGTSSCSD